MAVIKPSGTQRNAMINAKTSVFDYYRTEWAHFGHSPLVNDKAAPHRPTIHLLSPGLLSCNIFFVLHKAAKNIPRAKLWKPDRTFGG